jgi:hypothetical protein
VALETTLNVVWLFLGIVAVATALAAARVRGAGPHRKRLQILCVAVIVAALFPYISATDDALRVHHFSPESRSQQSGKHSPSDNLLRLYEVMDAPLAAAVYKLVVTLFLLAFTVPTLRLVLELSAPMHAGRSPPLN